MITLGLIINILVIATAVLLAASVLLLLFTGAEATILALSRMAARPAPAVAGGDGAATLTYRRAPIVVTTWRFSLFALLAVAALAFLFFTTRMGDNSTKQLLIALLLVSALPLAATLLYNQLRGEVGQPPLGLAYIIPAALLPLLFIAFLFLYNGDDIGNQETLALLTNAATILALALLINALLRVAALLFGHLTRKQQEGLSGWTFITPALIILGTFTFGAMVYAFIISFTDLGLFNEPKFVGFDTYGKVLSLPEGGVGNILNKLFYKALGNTVIFSVIVVFFQTWLAIIFAVILNGKIRFRNFFRVAWYLPSVTASVVVSLIFFWLYKQQGVINAIISWVNDHTIGAIFGTHYDTVAFLDNTTTALPAIMTMNIFTTVPTFMVMFLAALQDIPPEVYEAARLDGASTTRTFFSITLPLLRPIIFLVVVLGTIGTLQVFDQIYLMSSNDGGPLGATTTVAYLIWYEAFKNNHLARSAAIGFVLFIIIFLFFLVQRRFLDKEANA